LIKQAGDLDRAVFDNVNAVAGITLTKHLLAGGKSPLLRLLMQRRPAVAERGVPHGTLIAYPEEIREAFLEIRSTSNPHQIITIIEARPIARREPR